jgi:hypothetical protein
MMRAQNRFAPKPRDGVAPVGVEADYVARDAAPIPGARDEDGNRLWIARLGEVEMVLSGDDSRRVNLGAL